MINNGGLVLWVLWVCVVVMCQLFTTHAIVNCERIHLGLPTLTPLLLPPHPSDGA